ncbi:hypothetical protein SS1G_09683 [Sclerotinia sclerotiorum 1980 UF-70]|uniref:Major facilitator superfamily (MFS) profile domain-containing protein n=1 Tax=Sclerotinia sclerotiorum (strain ATCC 18683 / 1980 / Ss-1) TaxID=665079 RepID=A7EWH4_SCLS1|nr:hypothetical protein SS1G_09683 [Sclerotinia sclerotiorum 1980 UF-70]EDN93816.1 hypothetical protein SS1G_09683 [Sclerotinia sclerotiorum 1980 UF-70]
MAQPEKRDTLYEYPYNPEDYDYHYYLDIPYGYDVETSTYNSALETARDFTSSIYEDSYEGKMERKDSLELKTLNSGSTYTETEPSIREAPSIARQQSTKSTKSFKHTQGLFKMMSIRNLRRSPPPEEISLDDSVETLAAPSASSTTTPVESKETKEPPKPMEPGGPGGPGGPPKEIFPEMDMEKNLVGWTGQDDPAHPRNLPDKKKWLMLASVSLITFLRQLGCALAPNIHVLILFRFFAGLGGSACLAIGGGVVADLFPIQQRGKAQAMFVMGPLFGPVLGPVIGGFIAQRAGWRWVYWVLLVACAALSIFYVIVGKETSASVLIRRKTIALRKETGNPDLLSAYDAKKPAAALKFKAVLLTGIARPFRMMFSSPILPLLALWMSFIFGLIYLLLTSIAQVFEEIYGFSIEIASLAYLGLGLGFFLGMFTVAKTSDPTIIALTKKNNGVYQPEFRLRNGLFFAFFIPGSFFWYGWTSYYRVHWIVPILGLIPFGFGTMGVFAGIQTYYIDTGKQYAASAMAGLTAIRCVFAAFLPLAGKPLYNNLGLGWGNSVLGFIGLSLIPAPFFIYKYGGLLRERYPVRVD